MGKYKVIFTLFYYIMKGGINNTHQNHLIKNLVKYAIIPHFDDVWSPLIINNNTLSSTQVLSIHTVSKRSYIKKVQINLSSITHDVKALNARWHFFKLDLVGFTKRQQL